MGIAKLIANLSSPSEKTREEAIIALAENPPHQVVGPLADLLLSHDSSEVHAACLDLLERFEAVAVMAEVRADGWFEEVCKRITHVAEICKVMGEHLLAYAFILGIQIRSLMLDPHSPWNTAVHFSLDGEQIQTLSLGEFKLRVVQALLQRDRVSVEPSLPFGVEQAAQVVGGRALLLAPIYGISIEHVMIGSLDAEKPRYLVSYLTAEGLRIQELGDFLDEIQRLIAQEITGVAEKPFTLDLLAVERARHAAEAGDTEAVIAALESWPGLLSMLLRTPVARQLDNEQLELIGEGLALLGEALEKNEREPWSEELYRLGLQFIREGRSAARLFWDLGKIMNDKEAYGVAIGLLRRALSLGYPETQVLPALGRAFLKQGKPVAAVALLERASADQTEAPHLEADLSEARNLIEGAGVKWPLPAQGEEDRPQ